MRCSRDNRNGFGVLLLFLRGYFWLEADPSGIVASATELASSTEDTVFIFSAGPNTNVLIPAMTRANNKNSYIDVGGALTMELAGKSTRDFHDSYVRAGVLSKKIRHVRNRDGMWMARQ